MESAYDKLPEAVKGALSNGTWPSSKAQIKNAMQAATNLRSLPFGTIYDLVLFGLEAYPGTQEDKARWEMLQSLSKIEQTFINQTPKTQTPNP